MTFNWIVWLLLINNQLALANQPEEEESAKQIVIPIVNRPSDHFYDAVGSGIQVQTIAEPTELATTNWIRYQIRILAVLEPARIRKPDLRSLALFVERFQIQDQQDPAVDTEKQERIFVYRLQPRNPSVEEIPAFPFYYFDPLIRIPEQAFPFSLGSAIPIRVSAPKEETTTQLPLDVPSFAESIQRGNQLLVSQSHRIEPWQWWTGLVTPILFAMAWYLVWRWIYPDELQQAKRRQSRAARKAIRQLQASETAEKILSILDQYLQDRWNIAVDQLERGRFTLDRFQPILPFWEQVQEVRFANQSGHDPKELQNQLRKLIDHLEGQA